MNPPPDTDQGTLNHIGNRSRPLTREKTQLVVVLGIGALWAFALLVAQVDGSMMLEITTPMLTGALGWLFSAKGSGG
jgi:hypothetical protein